MTKTISVSWASQPRELHVVHRPYMRCLIVYVCGLRVREGGGREGGRGGPYMRCLIVYIGGLRMREGGGREGGRGGPYMRCLIVYMQA